MSRNLAANCGSFDILKVRIRCGFSPCAAQIRCTLRWLIPAALAIIRPLQCVVSPGGPARVMCTTRSIVAGAKGGLRPGRVASRSRPSTPASMKRCCQRQMVGLALPVRRWISIVPIPSALSSTIRDRQTCFCGLFLEAMMASSRSRAGLKPLAISQAEANFDAGSHPGSFPQAGTEGNLSLAPAHPLGGGGDVEPDRVGNSLDPEAHHGQEACYRLHPRAHLTTQARSSALDC